MARITRPPFRIVWDLAEIPNQVSEGARIAAHVELPHEKKHTQFQEGIFLLHHPVSARATKILKPGRIFRKHRRTNIALQNSDSSLSAQARIHWSEENLVFSIAVKHSVLRTDLPVTLQRLSGCEILLDPTLNQLPYLSDSVFVLRIPLQGNAQQRWYKPIVDPLGGFTQTARSDAYAYPCSVKTIDNVGWQIQGHIPATLLGTPPPQVVHGNIVVRVAHTPDNVSSLAQYGRTSQQHYSPTYWGAYILQRQSLLNRPWLLFTLSFVAGVLVVLVVAMLTRSLGQVKGMVLPSETPESEKRVAENIQAHIDMQVPDKNTTLKSVARHFSLNPNTLNTLIRKYHHRPFWPHLIQLRIEVAKERLRSSNADEVTICRQCGFESIEEMEKMFLKYCGVTPYKYRLENQVT